MFIQELTHRSWLKAQECQHQTHKKIDFFTVLKETELFDFLVDAISMDDPKEEAPTYVPGMLGNIPNRIPYYYSPMGPPAPPMAPLAPSVRPPAPSMGPPAPSMPTPSRGSLEGVLFLGLHPQCTSRLRCTRGSSVGMLLAVIHMLLEGAVDRVAVILKGNFVISLIH